METLRTGAFTDVIVNKNDVREFKKRWPASGLPDETIVFVFDNRNGDLVDMKPSNIDGDAVVALSQDAQKFAGL